MKYLLITSILLLAGCTVAQKAQEKHKETSSGIYDSSKEYVCLDVAVGVLIEKEGDLTDWQAYCDILLVKE